MLAHTNAYFRMGMKLAEGERRHPHGLKICHTIEYRSYLLEHIPVASPLHTSAGPPLWTSPRMSLHQMEALAAAPFRLYIAAVRGFRCKRLPYHDWS